MQRTKSVNFAGRPGPSLTESDALQTTSPAAKLSRQRSSRGGRRSGKETAEDMFGDGCLFEKIEREGGLAPVLPRKGVDATTKAFFKRVLSAKLDGREQRICPETGKNWTKEWQKQQQDWAQATIHRSLA